jgi:hypothetical protein
MLPCLVHFTLRCIILGFAAVNQTLRASALSWFNLINALGRINLVKHGRCDLFSSHHVTISPRGQLWPFLLFSCLGFRCECRPNTLCGHRVLLLFVSDLTVRLVFMKFDIGVTNICRGSVSMLKIDWVSHIWLNGVGELYCLLSGLGWMRHRIRST